MQEILFVSERLRGSYQLLPHESWKFCSPYLTWKCSFSIFVPPPTKIYDYLKKLPDKHHMNHIIPKQYFMILPPSLQRSCPSHIISHKIFMLLQQGVCGFISTSFQWVKNRTPKVFLSQQENKWFNNCSYSDWYKFRYLRNTTSCLCNCSPSSLNNKQSQPVVLNSHHTVPSQWYSIPHYLLYHQYVI